jgi:hypothetical protein
MTTLPKFSPAAVRESMTAANRPAPIGRHEAAAKALSAAGLLRGSTDDAARLLEKHFVAQAPRAYNWAADSEFLHQSIAHHLGAYTRQVLEPQMKSFHQRGGTGRLLKEEDVEKAAEEITALVASEMSDSYRADIGRYVGRRDGFLAYIFTRVRNTLIEEALEFNKRFLASKLGQKTQAMMMAPPTEKPR